MRARITPSSAPARVWSIGGLERVVGELGSTADAGELGLGLHEAEAGDQERRVLQAA
jgi:hypothetical protein